MIEGRRALTKLHKLARWTLRKLVLSVFGVLAFLYDTLALYEDAPAGTFRIYLATRIYELKHASIIYDAPPEFIYHGVGWLYVKHLRAVRIANMVTVKLHEIGFRYVEVASVYDTSVRVTYSRTRHNRFVQCNSLNQLRAVFLTYNRYLDAECCLAYYSIRSLVMYKGWACLDVRNANTL